MPALAFLAMLVFGALAFAAGLPTRGAARGGPAPIAVEEEEPDLGDEGEGPDQESPAPGDDLEEGRGSPATPPERAPALPSPPRQEDEESPAPSEASPTASGPAEPAGPAEPLAE